MKLFGKAFTIAILVGGAALASADWAGGTMHSTGVGPANIIHLSFQSSGDGGNGNYYAGILRFNEQHGGGQLGVIDTVCADLFHDFSVGNTWNDNGFDPSSNFTGWVGKRFFSSTSLVTAGNLVSFGFLNFSFGATSQNDLGAGLQIATWAALYNDTTSNSIGFSGSSLTVGQSGHQVTISNISAGAMAAATYFWTGRNTAHASIFIEADHTGQAPPPYGQDMLTIGGSGRHLITPEPVTMSLGFAAVGLFLKRRLKSSKKS